MRQSAANDSGYKGALGLGVAATAKIGEQNAKRRVIQRVNGGALQKDNALALAQLAAACRRVQKLKRHVGLGLKNGLADSASGHSKKL